MHLNNIENKIMWCSCIIFYIHYSCGNRNKRYTYRIITSNMKEVTTNEWRRVY